LALTTAGRVYVWGNGEQFQLGRRIIERRKINALEPESLGLRNIVYVAAGSYHSFAIASDGTVWAWGLNTFHQTGIDGRAGDEDMVNIPAQVDSLHPDNHGGSKVIQISGGEHHSMFLFDNGEVWGCGRSDDDQVGIAEDHPAYEGILERRAEMRKGKQEKLDDALKALEAVNANRSATQDDKDDAEREVATAQAIMSAAVDEYVPEPVRVSYRQTALRV
jgi:regulator of chromosome condensation